MKKVLFIFAVAMMFQSCENRELEEVSQEYKKAENEKKESVDFNIFRDRTQTGKGETR